MLLMRQSSVLCFLTLTTLASSISNCTDHFAFPNLKDSQHIIWYSNKNISVEFRVNLTCSTPFTGAFYVRDKTKSFCTFFHQNGSCAHFTNTDYCHCPEEGSDLYRVENPAAIRQYNGTWTWTSSSSRVKEHKMHIVILELTSPKSPETTQQTLMSSEFISVSWTTIGSDDERFYTALFSSVPGIIMMTVNAVIVVSFISLVVFVIRRKVTIRKRLTPQHDIALQAIQDRNQQPPHSPPAQPQQQQQQQRRLPEIPGQYQVPSSVPASSRLDARRSVGRVSHVYEVVGGDQEGEGDEALKTELPDTNLEPRPPAQEMTAAQASKPGIGNGLYFHIHPKE